MIKNIAFRIFFLITVLANIVVIFGESDILVKIASICVAGVLDYICYNVFKYKTYSEIANLLGVSESLISE